MKRETTLRLAWHGGKNDEEGAQGLLVKVRKRMAQPDDPLWAGQGAPLLVSAGDLFIPPAMLAVLGQEAVGLAKKRGGTGIRPTALI